MAAAPPPYDGANEAPEPLFGLSGLYVCRMNQREPAAALRS